MSEAIKIHNCLMSYAIASGQTINYGKSSIALSPNTPRDIRTCIAWILNIANTEGKDIFLGLPSSIGRSKKQAFAHFKERIRKKVSCWKEQCLSKSGKEILIKSIATAIPSYAMSCFKFSSTFCKEINALLSNFWWGQKVIKEKFIGLVGIISVNPNVVVGLVFEILNALIVLFLLSKGGGSSPGLMLFSPGF